MKANSTAKSTGLKPGTKRGLKSTAKNSNSKNTNQTESKLREENTINLEKIQDDSKKQKEREKKDSNYKFMQDEVFHFANNRPGKSLSPTLQGLNLNTQNRAKIISARNSAFSKNTSASRSINSNSNRQNQKRVFKTTKNSLTRSRLLRPELYANEASQGRAQRAGSTIGKARAALNLSSQNSNKESSSKGNSISHNSSSGNQISGLEKTISNYLKQNDKTLAKKFNSNKKFQEEFTAGVDKLARQLDIRIKDKVTVSANKENTLNGSKKASATDRVKLASAYMSALVNIDKAGMVDKIAKSGMSVVLTNSIKEGTGNSNTQIAGYFSTDNHMVLDKNPGFTNLHTTAIHELTHKIDHMDGKLDGAIRGLNNWTNIRAEAVDKIQGENFRLSGLDSNFLEYALTNNQEFLAVMSQLYHTDGADLLRELPNVFNSLDSLFRLA